MNYKKIVVAGGGILGSQIAFQTAYCGFDVTILIRKEDSKEELNKKLRKLHDTYVDTINEMTDDSSLICDIIDGVPYIFMPNLYKSEMYCAERIIMMRQFPAESLRGIELALEMPELAPNQAYLFISHLFLLT